MIRLPCSCVRGGRRVFRPLRTTPLAGYAVFRVSTAVRLALQPLAPHAVSAYLWAKPEGVGASAYLQLVLQLDVDVLRVALRWHHLVQAVSVPGRTGGLSVHFAPSVQGWLHDCESR